MFWAVGGSAIAEAAGRQCFAPGIDMSTLIIVSNELIANRPTGTMPPAMCTCARMGVSGGESRASYGKKSDGGMVKIWLGMILRSLDCDSPENLTVHRIINPLELSRKFFKSSGRRTLFRWRSCCKEMGILQQG